ncbi:hypothetical protein DY000_02039309 [Brassica cretica]|uniref:VQ domain-containing protein n=1 Tax=Brassica cretica TaxID=69181 RepID=A0ABQ7BPQ4_BRACR|nr:hypothetical protein DY000_02039309 [Brassica cretica]
MNEELIQSDFDDKKHETRLYPHLYMSPHFHKALASTSRVMTVCVSSSSWRPLVTSSSSADQELPSRSKTSCNLGKSDVTRKNQEDFDALISELC